MWLVCHLSSIATWKMGTGTSRQDRGDWMARPVLVGFQKFLIFGLLNLIAARTMAN